MPRGIDLKIDTDKMRSAAKVIENQRHIIKGCFDSIRSDALGLSRHWGGESSNAYYDRMKRMCHDTPLGVNAGHVLNLLSGYIDFLNQTANNWDATEGRLKTKQEALPTDVFGV
jgi:uncharacterized protein YukE